jgi:hypothetical protein
MWNKHTTEYHSASKGILTHATTCMNLEEAMLNEILYYSTYIRYLQKVEWWSFQGLRGKRDDELLSNV